MGEGLDYSKLTDQQLEDIKNEHYENLPDDVLEALHKEHTAAAATKAAEPQTKSGDAFPPLLGSALGLSYAPTASEMIGGGYAAKMAYDLAQKHLNKQAPETNVNVVSEHGFTPGAVSNAQHNVEQRGANVVHEATEANKIPGFEVSGNSRIITPIGTYKEPVAAPAPTKTIPQMKAALSKTAAEPFAKKIVNTAAPFAALPLAGANAANVVNAIDQGSTPRAVVNTLGTAGSLASMVPFLKGKPRAIAALLGGAAPGVDYLLRKFENRNQPEPEEGHAAGGQIQNFDSGGQALVKKAAQFLFKERPTQFMKASEAFAPHEGKFLGLTQTDNYGVHGGRWGGNQFPNFQNTNPLHQEHRVVWMNDTPEHAQDMIDRSHDNMVWSTRIGAPDQLKSNKSVAQDILNEHYKRELSPEQIDLINQRIATMRAGPKKNLVFPQPFDIRDKFAAQELGLDTFARRAALADMLGAGKGVGQTKGGIALPNYEDILRAHRDPLTEGVPTSSVGTRLFTVDPTIPTRRTDMFHPDYRDTVHGDDLGVQFAPIPQHLAVPDWYNEINARAPGKTHGNAWFSYMNNPQQITEDWLTNLQKEGHAGGGKIGILETIAKKILPAAEHEANKAKFLEKSAVKEPMYHGTSSDIHSFNPSTPANAIFLTRNPNFATHFAEARQGDQVQNMVKNMTGEELTNALYHTSQGSKDVTDKLGGMLPARANIMPVHVNAQNPFDYQNPEHIDNLVNELNKSSWEDGTPMGEGMGHILKHGDWEWIEKPYIQNAIKNLGHDSFWVQEGGEKNLGVYHPTQVKSATGNVGTFDPTNPDITKKEGGEVEGYAGGKQVVSQIPQVARALEDYLRGKITNAERIEVVNKYLPARKWQELPPAYTDEQIRNALMANKQSRALADVPVGAQVGNRLDIPAYINHGVYVDTVHNAKGSPISYNRTGHLKDVEFSSKPNQAARVGLGTQEQALTPLGAEIGTGKSPFALIKGTNQGTSDDEVRRMLAEYMNDPNWTQIGMDPRKHSAFYDKSTGLPVFSATEKLQAGPLVMVPKSGLETTHWDDPRLDLTDERLLLSDPEGGLKYKEGGHATPAWQRSEGKNPEGYAGGGKLGALESLAKNMYSHLPRVDSIPKMSLGPTSITPRVIAEDSHLYHETSPYHVNSLLGNDRQFDYNRVFVSNNPDLAIGQGDNKGVKVVFRPNSLSGEENVKPFTGDLAGREYLTDIVAPNAISEVHFSNPKQLKQLSFPARTNLQRGFDKTVNDDNTISYVRKLPSQE